MKNIIKYYYGLDVDNIIEKDDNYKLIINSNNYLLCKCIKDELLSIINYIPNNYKFHTIIKTINNDICIVINNNQYVLLKLNTPYKKIDIKDINDFNYPIYQRNDSINRWISLWSSHIDYIEYQMHELSNKYPILYKYVYYYIGLTETAIELLKTFTNNTYEYIEHKRININMTMVDLYNPVNLMLDSRVRDMAEYYKSVIFSTDNDPLNEILESIKYYSESELILFLIRMLYPTYFFDAYDQIIGFNKDEDIIYNIVEKSDKYEVILKELYNAIKKATHIENIEWLNQLH
jgi:hypothetical protein